MQSALQASCLSRHLGRHGLDFVHASGVAIPSIGDIASADRIGRIGTYYVRSLAAQAGIRNEETSPGEDYGAVDLTVHLTKSPVTVQVKTGTSQRRNKDGTYSVPVKAEWCAKWSNQGLPVYLVLVVLSRKDFACMVTQAERSTTWHAHAYWTQVNDAQSGTVRVPVQNRLHLDTFRIWDDQVRRVFTGGAA